MNAANRIEPEEGNVIALVDASTVRLHILADEVMTRVMVDAGANPLDERVATSVAEIGRATTHAS